MRELREILAAWERTRSAGGRAVLATIVDASGSTYRRPGARMLIPERGDPVGLLSGGCLEGDLAERAAAVPASGKPRCVVYDMTSQDDLVWGLGLGCAGKLHVLLEPLPGPAEAYLAFLARCHAERAQGAVATLIESADPGRVGRRRTLDAAGGTAGSLGAAALDESCADLLAAARDRGITRLHAPGGIAAGVRVLIEGVVPPPALVVFGAGPDAVPVVRLAGELGWHVTVVDHRAAFAVAARFPEAAAVVCCDPAEVPRRVAFDAASAALVMTHKFLHDVELARVLLPSAARYVGFLGPRAHTEQLLLELRRQGLRPTPDQLARVHGPVGLDIGAETPEEIALSAIAEIRAALLGRRGGPLRDRVGPLHEPHR